MSTKLEKEIKKLKAALACAECRIRLLSTQSVRAHLAKIGAKGGKAKSPAKTRAARKAIKERWRKYRLLNPPPKT